jgi:hypothetical protein
MSGMAESGEKHPQPGWDEQVMEEKSRWLAEHVLEEAHIDALLDILWHFEEMPSVSEFTRMLE